MGGRVAEISAKAAELGVNVIRAPGCESRGNGSAWHPDKAGHNVHHTAGGNNIYLDQILVNGRSDLSGPLCNWALLYDGDLCIVSYGPANHAGASGGWDTAPLPVTNDFNRRMYGTEVQYKGTEPMSAAQWLTLSRLNAAIMIVEGVGPEYIKTHQGTSIQGKWDPGYAYNPAKTYPIADIRNAAIAVRDGGTKTPTKENDVGFEQAIRTRYENRDVAAGDVLAWTDFHANEVYVALLTNLYPTKADYRFLGEPEPASRVAFNLVDAIMNADARAYEARQMAAQVRDQNVKILKQQEQILTALAGLTPKKV